MPEVFLCFDRDEAGRDGALNVARLLPKTKVIELPEAVGEGGDVTDFFVRLGAGRAEFLKLMEQAKPLPREVLEAAKERFETPSTSPDGRSDDKVERVKRGLPIAGLIGEYVPLRRSGRTWIGLCPFHEDRQPSFAVYPDTNTFYCFGCQRHGDVITFLMEKAGLSVVLPAKTGQPA